MCHLQPAFRVCRACALYERLPSAHHRSARFSPCSLYVHSGDFIDLPLARYDRLKDQKKIVTNKNGLDVFVPGFDPAAPEPKQKLFGVF